MKKPLQYSTITVCTLKGALASSCSCSDSQYKGSKHAIHCMLCMSTLSTQGIKANNAFNAINANAVDAKDIDSTHIFAHNCLYI